MFAENVLVRSILVLSARLRFSTITALYKFTYSLTYLIEDGRKDRRGQGAKKEGVDGKRACCSIGGRSSGGS